MRNSDDERGKGEEDEFYESLDRILSSSCSSTSASASASDDDRPQRFGGSSMYDVWISEPSSVEERRRRLLWQMGLINDPSLSRKQTGGHDHEGDGEEKIGDGRVDPAGDQVTLQSDMGRLACCDAIHQEPDLQRNSPSSSISRSRHDGAMDPNPSSSHLHVHKQHPSPKEPPTGNSPSSGADTNDSDGDLDDGREDCFENGYRHREKCELCFTIKNLNNGDKFVVKELREDGMWKRLREVGTGRQLTMEEFQSSVIGHSPIVQELMRRQSVEEEGGDCGSSGGGKMDITCPNGVGLIGDRWMRKKSGSLLRTMKNMAGHDERDSSSEKGGRRSSSATDDSQGAQSHHGPERIKVRKYGKSLKELTGLYMSQEIQAHKGSIWSIKFSLDGRHLASAGEDSVIRVWQVTEKNMKGGLLNFSVFGDGSPEPLLFDFKLGMIRVDRERRSKVPIVRNSLSFEQIVVPEYVFALSEKPVCSFHGHLEDVLDLSWSKSEHLLSSSMDKTVRLWHMSSNSCLKIFSHSDYVTCIQFNPVDDNYFISGSLDAKVRIWSIRDRQVVDWNDLREMITAVCYRPDGQGALVGSHKGSCHLYDTSENKLQQRRQINLQNKKKRSHHKKITGFQVLVTSADSRIRVIDGLDLVHKFKGIRNTSSQIAGSFTADGEYVICPSEDSHVCVWRYDSGSRASRRRSGVGVTQSHEHFHCRDVSAAVAWPVAGCSKTLLQALGGHRREQAPPSAKMQQVVDEPSQQRVFPSEKVDQFTERVSATWPEEKLLVAAGGKEGLRSSGGFSGGEVQLRSRSAWGMVVVTAGRGGEIRIFQNFGCPSRI
ncbi:unnamed protein product [Spirodela intermedia]|uniref:Uncharacterized protein n=1 Tax=Spirodela intermedia TaxID=51605 RepID=A0A7I8ID35_SPIIN|nr:unnamed protein product [Spirodela intermedia]CAA6655690.1 unnamed protein product [Spirodela intermedia]